MIYDAIIVGAGPAGCQCAIYLGRFNFKVLMIGGLSLALNAASKIENYFGVPSISGLKLQQIGIEQVQSLGIEVLDLEVTAIKQQEHFEIMTNAGSYTAKSILIATGAPSKKLKNLNLDDFEGSGVSYCAMCDGFFYRQKRVGLLGSGEYMEHEYNVLKNFTDDIIVFTNGEDYPLSRDKSVIREKITKLVGEDELKAVLTEGNEYPVDGLFVAYGKANAVDFAIHLGLEIQNNYIVVNDNYMTNIKGIFAAGDCIGGILQLSKAIHDGMNAAFMIKKYLNNKIEV